MKCLLLRLNYGCSFLTEDINECDPNPCTNDGTCTQGTPGTFSCQCATGFAGTTCDRKYCLFHLYSPKGVLCKRLVFSLKSLKSKPPCSMVPMKSDLPIVVGSQRYFTHRICLFFSFFDSLISRGTKLCMYNNTD